MEDQLEHFFETVDWNEVYSSIESRDSSLSNLQQIADAFIKAPEGPVQVGVENRILTPTSVKEIAAHYSSAFQDGIQCFPYFAQNK